MVGRFLITALVDTTVPPAKSNILASNSQQSLQRVSSLLNASLTTQLLQDVTERLLTSFELSESYIAFHHCTPRIISLNSTSNPRHSHAEHLQQSDRITYLYQPPLTGPRHSRRYSRRHHASRKPSPNSHHTRLPRRCSITSWKDKLGFHSRPAQQEPRSLTPEEKLRVATERVRQFERQPNP